MEILAYLLNTPPRARVGGFSATFEYLARLAEEGHRVVCLSGARAGTRTSHRGVRIDPIENIWSHLHRADVCISNNGDDARLHRPAIQAGKPSIRFVHGPHDMVFHRITDGGIPTRLIFNSHSLAAEFNYAGPSMVCHPILRFDEYATTRGYRITLVNLIKPKGAELFDFIARALPDHNFLGVRSGYNHGDEYAVHRPNIEVIPTTSNMRDDVYARTKILLVPSDFETWGLVAVEALCSGIPVIASPTPGLKESLGAAGLFAKRDEPELWIEHIEWLDNPKNYIAQSELCLRRAQELAADDSFDRFHKMLSEVT